MALFILFAIASFIFPSRMAPYRQALLIASVIICGFMYGNLLSLDRMVIWMRSGVQLSLLTGLVAFTVIVALFGNKNWYCSCVCPYGCAQELAGKFIRKKPIVPRSVHRGLRIVRSLILIVIAVFLLADVAVNYAYLEPFAAFQLRSAPVPVLLLAGVFLFVSLVIPRFWCTYLCPTGHILDLFRRPLRKNRPQSAKEFRP